MVGRQVLRSRAGGAVVATPGGEAGAVEALHVGEPGGREREVDRWPQRPAGDENQILGSLGTEARRPVGVEL